MITKNPLNLQDQYYKQGPLEERDLKKNKLFLFFKNKNIKKIASARDNYALQPNRR